MFLIIKQYKENCRKKGCRTTGPNCAEILKKLITKCVLMSCHVLTNLVLVAFLVVDLEPAALPPVVTDGVVCHLLSKGYS